jgi:hypothetical protein
MKLLAALLATVTLLPTAQASSLKTIRLLDGKVWFAVPSDLAQITRQIGPEAHCVDLIAMVSPDHHLSVLATYGNHAMRRHELQNFLDQKVTSYSKLVERHPHFHWINHGLVERQGREWAQVSFAHDGSSPAGAEIYTRSVSTVLEGHLLELWALSRMGEKTVVDQIIDSVQVPR